MEGTKAGAEGLSELMGGGVNAARVSFFLFFLFSSFVRASDERSFFFFSLSLLLRPPPPPLSRRLRREERTRRAQRAKFALLCCLSVSLFFSLSSSCTSLVTGSGARGEAERERGLFSFSHLCLSRSRDVFSISSFFLVSSSRLSLLFLNKLVSLQL